MKKFRFLFMGLAALLLCGTSCSDDRDSEDLSKTVIQENNQEECKICTFDLVNADLFGKSDTLSQKAVIKKDYKWRNGDTIRIKFLNGDSFLQNKVKQYANEWMRYANLKFVYVASNQNADIRVAFKWDGDGSSWSYIGNYCRYIPQNEPTINFGWFTTSTAENEFSRTILHEFGHALGLKHEHQHPLNDIQWNKPVVYAYYARQGWSQSEVDYNIFERLSKTSTNYTAYDKYSIMHYSIDARLTTNGYSVGWNRVLSSTDKQFISNQYPYSITFGGLAVPADYDGDGKKDIAYKTNTGTWLIDYAKNGFGSWDEILSGYGNTDAIPVPADYDGDGKADLAVKRSSGLWYIDYARNGFGKWDVSYSGYGGEESIPSPADYDGDGKSDLAVKTSSGMWNIDYAKNGFGYWDASYSCSGSQCTIPAPADYDGDGKADLAIKTHSFIWLIDYAENGFGKWDNGFLAFATGISVPADYDGDGKTDVAIKTGYGKWLIDYARNGFGEWDVSYSGYGGDESIPVPADYDGDGKADLAVKTSSGLWYIDYAVNEFGVWDWAHKY